MFLCTSGIFWNYRFRHFTGEKYFQPERRFRARSLCGWKASWFLQNQGMSDQRLDPAEARLAVIRANAAVAGVLDFLLVCLSRRRRVERAASRAERPELSDQRPLKASVPRASAQ
jgi:hypothetical protein